MRGEEEPVKWERQRLTGTSWGENVGLGVDSQEYEWLAGVDELWGVDGCEEGEMNWFISLDTYPD